MEENKVKQPEKKAQGQKRKANYFSMLAELVEYSKASIEYLKEAIENFDPNPDVLQVRMKELHAIEHTADGAKHAMMEKLAREFITPIEREDIIDIGIALDDVTDSIEDILQKIYIFHIKTMRPEALEFIHIIEQCVEKLQVVYGEFHNFKRSKTIHKSVIELNTLEEDGDDLYIRAMHRLYDHPSDPIEAYAWTVLYDQMEKCCDRCEQAGNLVESVMMKNM